MKKTVNPKSGTTTYWLRFTREECVILLEGAKEKRESVKEGSRAWYTYDKIVEDLTKLLK